MAAVDSLLQIARDRRADGLLLRSGAVPVLLTGQAEKPLTMPAVDHALVKMFATELSGGELEVGTAEIKHRCPAGYFRVRIEAEKDRLRLAFVAIEDDHATGTASEPATTNGQSPAANAQAPTANGQRPTTDGERRTANGQRPTANGQRPTASDLRVHDDRALHDGPRPPVPIETAAPRLAAILRAAHRAGASDVIVSAGQPIRQRTDGVLRALEATPATERELSGVLAALTDAARAHLEVDGSADLAIELQAGERFRANVFRHGSGLALAARPVRSNPPTLESLRLPGSLARLAEFSNGLVLVAGPTGSGKSTTVVALIEHLNRARGKHIITLEDPIEYRYASKRSLIHQREVGVDVPSFAVGLRAALRENPDVIVVGEMRDSDTIAAALTAAELGHLVISTIHSRGAAWALNRIVDGMPSDSRSLIAAQLAGSLRAVMTQTLVADTRGGRVAAHELLLNNEAVAQKLREGNVHHVGTLIETNRAHGMRLFEDSLAELVKRGDIGVDEAVAVSARPDTLRQLLR